MNESFEKLYIDHEEKGLCTIMTFSGDLDLYNVDLFRNFISEFSNLRLKAINCVSEIDEYYQNINQWEL